MPSDVYVPSRGRADNAPTIKELVQHGVSPLVIVPYGERGKYMDAFPDVAVIGVEQQGIGQVRQWILQDARRRGLDRFWMLDDDLDDPRKRAAFGEPYVFCPWDEWLSSIEDLTPGVGAATGMSRQWGWPEDSAIPNVRVGYAILMRTYMPVNYWPFLHEDTDMALQILTAGYTTLKLPQYVFHTTTMNWRGGGCGEDYDRGAAELAGTVLLDKWERRNPGLVKLRKNKEGNTVTRVRWSDFRQEGTFANHEPYRKAP